MTKVLIPLLGDDVAPRFDLAAEALVAVIDDKKRVTEERTIILPQASAEALCNLIVMEKVDEMICCAIEEEYYQYLTWKNVKIIDSVAGSSHEILEKARIGKLRSGDMSVVAHKAKQEQKRSHECLVSHVTPTSCRLLFKM